MDIVEVNKGDFKAEVDFVKGEIIASANVETKGIQAKVEVKIPSDYFLDQLAAKIPGTLDDSIVAMIKLALKAL